MARTQAFKRYTWTMAKIKRQHEQLLTEAWEQFSLTRDASVYRETSMQIRQQSDARLSDAYTRYCEQAA